MQTKHYCIIYGKKIPNLTKSGADFPSSAGISAIPKMMGRNAVDLLTGVTKEHTYMLLA